MGLILLSANAPTPVQAADASPYNLAGASLLLTNWFPHEPFTAIISFEIRGPNFYVTDQIGFSADGGKLRSYTDAANIKSDLFGSRDVQASKNKGQNTTILITRLDTKMRYRLFPALKRYEEERLPADSTNAAALTMSRTVLGRDETNGNLCDRVEYRLSDSTNHAVVAIVWHAIYRENFPIVIQLAPNELGVTTTFKFREMKFGKVVPQLFEVPADYTKYEPEPEVPHDGGVIRRTSTIRTETKAQTAARVLQFHEELAFKGDRYGEYQMGLRYRDGDGVPRDLKKARDYLTRAANQGYPDAPFALALMPPPPPSKDVTIILATFGNGSHTIDVTDRLNELLRTEADGFTVDYESLKADPLPGKKKRLEIRYRYESREYTFTISGGKELGVKALIKNARDH